MRGLTVFVRLWIGTIDVLIWSENLPHLQYLLMLLRMTQQVLEEDQIQIPQCQETVPPSLMGVCLGELSHQVWQKVCLLAASWLHLSMLLSGSFYLTYVWMDQDKKKKKSVTTIVFKKKKKLRQAFARIQSYNHVHVPSRGEVKDHSHPSHPSPPPTGKNNAG